jgi:hypothetical protein
MDINLKINLNKKTMKTLKSMLAGIALLFICLAANAITKPANSKPTKDDVLKIYIDAITNGKISNLNNVLDDDMQFDMQRGENVNTLNKAQLLEYLKNNATSDPSVKTTTAVEQEDDNSSVIKVEFKYDGYSRTDEVTMMSKNGWVITKVVSTFK